MNYNHPRRAIVPRMPTLGGMKCKWVLACSRDAAAHRAHSLMVTLSAMEWESHDMRTKADILHLFYFGALGCLRDLVQLWISFCSDCAGDMIVMGSDGLFDNLTDKVLLTPRTRLHETFAYSNSDPRPVELQEITNILVDAVKKEWNTSKEKKRAQVPIYTFLAQSAEVVRRIGVLSPDNIIIISAVV